MDLVGISELDALGSRRRDCERLRHSTRGIHVITQLISYFKSVWVSRLSVHGYYYLLISSLDKHGSSLIGSHTKHQKTQVAYIIASIINYLTILSTFLWPSSTKCTQCIPCIPSHLIHPCMPSPLTKGDPSHKPIFVPIPYLKFPVPMRIYQIIAQKEHFFLSNHILEYMPLLANTLSYPKKFPMQKTNIPIFNLCP